MPTLITERIRSLVLAAAVRADVDVDRAAAIADTTVRAMCRQLGGRNLWLPVSEESGHIARAQNTLARYHEWAKLRREGASPTEIAARYRVSRVSVWRGIRRVADASAKTKPGVTDNPAPSFSVQSCSSTP